MFKDKGKGKAPRASSSKAAEVIELSSDSENEGHSQQKRGQSQLERDLSLVRAVIPDAHSKWLIKLYRDPRFERDPERIVDELLTNNYPLKTGGWKYPRDGGEEGQQKKADSASPKKKQVNEGKGKRKQRDSDDDDEEVDQLDSDGAQAADDGDEEEVREYTAEEAIERAAYWLGNVNRKFGDDDYRKAAWVPPAGILRRGLC